MGDGLPAQRWDTGPMGELDEEQTDAGQPAPMAHRTAPTLGMHPPPSLLLCRACAPRFPLAERRSASVGTLADTTGAKARATAAAVHVQLCACQQRMTPIASASRWVAGAAVTAAAPLPTVTATATATATASMAACSAQPILLPRGQHTATATTAQRVEGGTEFKYSSAER
jgi:hypothetical protein